MKYIVMGTLALLITSVSCNKASKIESQADNGTVGNVLGQEIGERKIDVSRIDTIVITDSYSESSPFEDSFYRVFDDRWIDDALHTLRQNRVPCELVVVENDYSEMQDSMLVFTGEDFRYSYLIVTHERKNILESFEETNLETREPIVKGLKERAKTVVKETDTQRSGKYVIHGTTISETLEAFITMNGDELISIAYFGWVD